MDGTLPTIGALKPFIYSPLCENEIRLFHITPSADFDSEVIGELRVITIADAFEMRYTALSYAWGPTYEDGSHLTDSIICNGCRLSVTANLKQALKRIRGLKCTKLGTAEPEEVLRALWVDALCINQDDVNEKSQQVARMAQIYNRNRLLIIWLGEPDPGKLGREQTKLLEMAHTTSQIRIYYWLRHYWYRMYDAHMHFLKSILSELQKPSVHIPYSQKRILMSILERPWFTRRWVIQETANRPFHSCVLLGNTLCRISAFVNLLELFDLANGNPVREEFSFKCKPILNLLYAYDKAECADARDRVYAFKDLSNERTQILVDYNKDVRNTYLDLMKTIALNISTDIEFVGNLQYQHPGERGASNCVEMIRMLAYASCKKTDTNDMESWIPDWRGETKFESDLHRWTVEHCVQESRMPIRARVSYSLLIAPTGYHYLNVIGMLVRPPSEPQVFNVSAHSNTLSNDHSTHLWLKAFFKASVAPNSNPRNQSDRIWLPFAAIGDPQVNGSTLDSSLAFILRPGRSGPAYRDKLIYRIFSCFTVEAPEPNIIFTSESSTPELKQSLSSAGFLFDQNFCLE